MQQIGRVTRRCTLTGAALAVVIALALGGSALAEYIDKYSPPVEGNLRSYYTITAKHSGLNLNVGGASTTNGAHIIQWNAPSHMNEQWEMLSSSAFNGYLFRNRWSRQCITSPSGVEGAAIVQRPCEGTADQLWQPKPPEDGGSFWYLANPATKFDLNIAGGSDAMGAELIQYRHVKGAANAKFDWVAHKVTD